MREEVRKKNYCNSRVKQHDTFYKQQFTFADTYAGALYGGMAAWN